MSTREDRRPPHPPRQPAQGPADRQARQRRAPLFPLADDDIASSARRGPPAPLGDLVGDIDQQLPTRAAPPRPAAPRPAAAPRRPEPPEPPPAPSRRDATPAHEAAPPRAAAPQREVATRERAPRRELRPAPVEELVEAQAAPLRQARGRLEDSSADLARLELELAARSRSSYSGYLAPAPLFPSLSSWAWLGIVALASVLILATLGGGEGGAGFSRWAAPLVGDGSELQSNVALFGGATRASGDYVLQAAPSITPEMIDRILASYGSPAAGTGADWYNLGLRYGIDPAFAVAFFIMESTAGTAQGWAGLKLDGGTTHNVGNIICAGYATCFQGHRDYSSWAAGIEDWYRLIQREYIEGRGHKTIGDVLPVYCPFSDGCRPDRYTQFVQETVDKWRNGILP